MLPEMKRERLSVRGQGHGAQVEQAFGGSCPPAFQSKRDVGRLIEGCTEARGCGDAPKRAGGDAKQQPSPFDPSALAPSCHTASATPAFLAWAIYDAFPRPGQGGLDASGRIEDLDKGLRPRDLGRLIDRLQLNIRNLIGRN